MKKSYKLIKLAGKKASTKINVLIDLVDLYIKKDDLSQARRYNKIGLHQSDSLNMLDFKIDFLIEEIKILVKQNKLNLALISYQKCLDHANLMANDYYIKRCDEIYPTILEAQGNHAEALLKYEILIEEEEANETKNLISLLGHYKSAHVVAQNNDSQKKAYDYLLKYNEVQESLSLDEQKQKTTYRKIKFDADQKDKENVILTSEVMQKKSQNQLLYGLAFMSLLFIIFLFGMVRQKRKYNEQLQNEVKDRTLKLEASNSLLTESNEELNQLTKILSHDLKEPIRSIVGFSSLAKKEISGNARLEEYFNFINTGGKQLHQLIEDVTFYQNIGSSQIQREEKVDLNEMFTNIKETLHLLIAEKNGTINLSLLPTIYTDEAALHLAFKILIENGLNYNESITPTIKISYEQGENKHCFYIEDNGIGIAPEFQKQIFGMFKRLNNRKIYKGSGLGLNTGKKILTKLNGDIELIHSSENKGSVFRITLPLIMGKEEIVPKQKTQLA